VTTPINPEHVDGRLSRSDGTGCRPTTKEDQRENKDVVTVDLGGGISPNLLQGRRAGRIEKTHLVLKRRLAERAGKKNMDFIDLGTDYSYPFFDTYPPTISALEALGHHSLSARGYPSSYGLIELRTEIAKFMDIQFGVTVDPMSEVMITTGASQAFDALSRTFCGDYFLIPELSLPTVNVIAIANGARPVRVELNPKTGLVDIDAAAALLDDLGRPSVRFMYINSPANPNGAVADSAFLSELVAFAKKYKILLMHDMDSWFQTHIADMALPNILEIDGASEVAITVLSFSKEFGLPGLRIGFVVGNQKVINALRIHNSEYCVMLPEPCQFAAIAALRGLRNDGQKVRIAKEVTAILDYTISQWHSLGWPLDAVQRPSAGFKYLLSPPPGFVAVGDTSGVELFDYFLATRPFVKLSTSRSFCEYNTNCCRVVVMQSMETMREVFRRFRMAGVHYGMAMPLGLARERISDTADLTLAEL
jgi:aspartate/methionine/tyrosine aminotransferase